MKSKESQTGARYNALGAPMSDFILIGKTGVGKSSFIKHLGGKDTQGKEPTVSHETESCTKEPTMYKAVVGGREIHILDTPGFDDSEKENMELLLQIVDVLKNMALEKNSVPVQGVIFLHDISETRFSGSQKKTLSILRALCGDTQMGNVIIGTTMWSQNGSAKFRRENEREETFRREHWGGICKVVRLEEDDLDAVIGVVTELLRKTPVLLQVQEEILSSEHPLPIQETKVGKLLVESQLKQDRGYIQDLLDKFNKGELNFAEKVGLSIAAPIILAPAAFIAAPVGIIATLVGVSNYFTKPRDKGPK